MKRVLITGIDSFTGRHLSSYLSKRGYEVFGTSLQIENANIHKCDITVKEEIEKVLKEIKPDFIIHLAGISFVAHQKVEDFYRVNTLGTQNLLESVQKAKKVVTASSAAVYGIQSNEVLSEDLCPNPNNHYAISKYGMEQITKTYFDKLPIVITRPFNYTGLCQSEIFLIPKIVKHYKEKKRVIELGNLDVIREFNDIGFVCEAYKRLLESEVHSEIVNIASLRGIKLLDVIEMMNKIAGYEIKINVNPRFVRKNEIKKLIGSKKKLVSLIGEVPQKELKETLKEMYENSC